MKAKRLLAALVAVCMLLSSLVGIAFADEGAYTCSNVSFGYVSGETWTDADDLEAGKDLSAKISVSKTGDKENVVFSLFVYSEDKIYDVNTIIAEVSADTSVLTATASLPEDVEDCYVSAFLWDNYVDANPICNISGFPNAAVTVTGIYVDGELIEGFDPGIKTYNIPVDPERQLMPYVQATTLDHGAKVTVTNPTRFPGSAVVEVTNGAGDKNTYKVNFTAEACVSDLDYTQNVYDNVAGAIIVPPIYSNMQIGSKAFFLRDGVNDSRTSTIAEVSDESLFGLDYIGAGIGWKNSPPYRDYYGSKPAEWLRFKLDRNATLKIVTSTVQANLEEIGFEAATVSNLMKADVNGTKYTYNNIYTKKFQKGTQVVLPALSASNGFFVFFEFDGYKESLVPGAELTGLELISKPSKLTYRIDEEADLTGLRVNAVHSNGVKVEITDYEVEVPDFEIGTNTVTVSYAGFSTSFDIEVEGITFGLNDLKVDGVAVEGFDIAKQEYSVTISANKKNIPVISATPTEGGNATVVDPTEFPGKATVTVTKDGEEDMVYTINYVLDKAKVTDLSILGDNMIPESYGGGNVSAMPKYHKGGFVVGTPAYADREDRTEGGARYSVLEITDPRLVGADYITGGITWYNGATPTVKAYTGSEDLDWMQFTVNRDATVYVLKHATIDEDKLLERGFEKSVSDNAHGYMYTLLNAENHRYHKYMYSKKVTAGNKVIIPNNQDDNNVFHTVITYDTYEELKPEVTLEELTITPPAKLSYYEGEELDLAGLVVTAAYSDDTTEVVTDYEVSTCDMSVGTHEITISYGGKTATFTITVEEEPVTLFGLTSLTVDGKAVAGFDTLTTEYNVTISANQKNFPVIDYVATEGATVTVEDPTEFPGSAVITVSKDGLEDVVYTLTYVTDKDRITNVNVLGDNKIPATYGGGNVSAKPKYYKEGFVKGVPAYADREDRVDAAGSYTVMDITDDRLVGADYITGCITWYNGSTPTVKAFTGDEDLDWLQFTVNRDATVYVLKTSTLGEEKLLSRGYTKYTSSNELGYLYTRLNNNKERYHKYMYTKSVSAGTVVVVPNAKENDNMYHTVVTFNSYEELEAEQPTVPDEPEATLTGIEIASEPTKVTYIEGEELDLTGLMVMGLYSDNSSKLVTDYEVSDCDMSVGTHTITISYEGFTAEFEITVEEVMEAELVYDIAYVPEVLSNLNPANGKTANPYLCENLQVGSPAYFCRDGVNDSRTSFTTAVHEDYLGLPYMGVGIAWKNSPPYRDYYGTKPDQWFKFTVGKDVKITLLTTAKVDAFETPLGFTYAAKSGALSTIINGANPYNFGHTYTKTFSAGDTIVLPSFYSSNALFILFEEIEMQ